MSRALSLNISAIAQTIPEIVEQYDIFTFYKKSLLNIFQYNTMLQITMQ